MVTLSTLSIIVAVGTGLVAMLVSWRLNVMAQEQNLITILKTKNEILTEENVHLKRDLNRTRDLLAYEGQKLGHFLAQNTVQGQFQIPTQDSETNTESTQPL